jgi:1-pyrroline-5-carboxylate dehydrogenase
MALPLLEMKITSKVSGGNPKPRGAKVNLMNNAVVKIPLPVNEPQFSYAPGSRERQLLKNELDRLKGERIEIPLIIGGKEVRTGHLSQVVQPHDHRHLLADCHQAGEVEVRSAIGAAMAAKPVWGRLRWEERAAIFLRAADLLADKYRYRMNGATMLSASKNVYQAEIDSACELIDFLRFNVYFAQQIYHEQPMHSPRGFWNLVQYRPLEGFVLAITPFNFTAIGGNLPTAPAIMGNTVIWKPASTGVYAAHFFMQILKEAGLPDGVINFVPGSGSKIGPLCLTDRNFAGVHFTGSTAVFQEMWKTIGENITAYRGYPRIVGETGGKGFVMVHASAEVGQVITALVRGAFEYQGQKCSAASRAYIPKSLWGAVRCGLQQALGSLKMGDIADFTNFINAVIDRKAFDKLHSYIQFAQSSQEAEIIIGGRCDDSQGYFIEPTVIVTGNPHFRTMEEELFGPVLTIHVYDDADYEETLEVLDATSPYALTGAVFATDRLAISLALAKLENAAGNFYINDKPTGAVVGQQPFGGGRASGTNDKAGSALNLLRWVSARTVKETFLPPEGFEYPFMQEP